MKKILTTLVFVFVVTSLSATTWDEPWQDEIIKKSQHFIYAKVISATDSLVVVEVQKSFGKSIKGKIIIDSFFLLNLCSSSGGHSPEFMFEKGQEGYFFLKQTEKGSYAIPTPTSGFDLLSDDKVHATYRHTYHKAAVDKEIYELTYTAIWNYFHDIKIDKVPLMKLIDEYLAKPPAGFEEDEVNIFYKQHVVLETVFLLDIELNINVLKKFIECDNYHSQISAARALSILKTKEAKNYMIYYLKKKEGNIFAQTMIVWGLWEVDPKILLDIKDELSKDETGFGGNIMDPRVCTYVPSPFEAIVALQDRK
ncbi:hypothetical protein GR160_05450 [Flavobacterium sp. Sd200]|uniref:hypothetical protein n=1 Tax=Flavobacterium sp. Sd200 TaxID=2692211 RepID=UPI00136C3E47|nr:hypothetical protein [Flavobacterium sp. Sd200]MXN90664.1 hypothetical protein [Flavobacterium sp. Sd200]